MGPAGDALARQAPGGLAYEEYFRFLMRLPASDETLRAIPFSVGPRFTLD